MRIVQQNLKGFHTHIKFDSSILKVGENIPFNIYIKKEKNYIIIIEMGTHITQKLIDTLQKQSTLYIHKDDQEKKNLSYLSLDTYIKHNLNSKEKCLSYLYEVTSKEFTLILKYDSILINKNFVETVVRNIIYLIKEDPHFLQKSITHFSDDYKIDQHSLHVAIYAVYIANKLNSNTQELQEIGTAALLHDIGIQHINQEVLEKYGKLSEDEMRNVRKHPSKSVEILKHNHFHNPYILDAVLHHHERYDGSGYPDKLYEKQIKKYASILSICDVFDALTNDRPYRKKFTYFEALNLMLKDPQMLHQFNREYLKVFLLSLTHKG